MRINVARGALLLVVGSMGVAGCATGNDGAGGGSTTTTTEEVCPAGKVVCDGGVAGTCDGEGGLSAQTDCGDLACEDGLGCVACAPGAGSCEAGVGRACGADGRFFSFECDPVQGMECAPDGCKGACSPAVLGESYLGCEYWPTVTMNGAFEEAFSFAVALGSTSSEVTGVSIEGPGLSFQTELAAGEVKTLGLPWVESLKGGSFPVGMDGMLQSVNPTENTAGKAYRVRTDRPIALYQFNPLEYQNTAPPASCPQFGGCFSFSNDASLLLPTNALTRSYHVTGYRTVFAGDFIAITATRDATEVTLRAGPHARSLTGAGVNLTANQSVKLTMGLGDVVQLFSRGTSISQTWSGSTILASAPVQVISGSPCALIPDSLIACDHLEETVLPAETLGKEYAVTVPRTPAGIVGTPHGGRHVVRIHGIHDGTQLTFDPPSIADKAAIDQGEVIELASVEEDFVVKGSAAFSVTHYMIGQGDPNNPGDGGAGAGDPSQSVAIPSEQYRKDYVFVAPQTFDAAFVNIVAAKGVAVEVDGTILGGNDFTPIGGSGKAAARRQLSKAPYHRATSSEPFGIVVYGYGQYASYMYPGGLDLRKIEEPVPE